MNSSRVPDDSFSFELDTLLTLSENTAPVEKSAANVQSPGSLSLSSSSISCKVSKSSAERSLLNFISSIIVFAFSGESTCTKTDNKYNLISVLSGYNMFNLSSVEIVCLKFPILPCCCAYFRFKSKSFGFCKICI